MSHNRGIDWTAVFADPAYSGLCSEHQARALGVAAATVRGAAKYRNVTLPRGNTGGGNPMQIMSRKYVERRCGNNRKATRRRLWDEVLAEAFRECRT